ncbi:hypothetical protein F444_19605 [Phytophthora nicotianae P1976]|uniref:Uncharacterized protein n=1 Tax=Phytophthora nicotianae P1976 TaxID=1317066 RepID=A0A080Z791_PHYNI|nr:hypothetical protein F444_19605 [Phytophthora nicotianae P1976]
MSVANVEASSQSWGHAITAIVSGTSLRFSNFSDAYWTQVNWAVPMASLDIPRTWPRPMLGSEIGTVTRRRESATSSSRLHAAFPKRSPAVSFADRSRGCVAVTQ